MKADPFGRSEVVRQYRHPSTNSLAYNSRPSRACRPSGYSLQVVPRIFARSASLKGETATSNTPTTPIQRRLRSVTFPCSFSCQVQNPLLFSSAAPVCLVSEEWELSRVEPVLPPSLCALWLLREGQALGKSVPSSPASTGRFSKGESWLRELFKGYAAAASATVITLAPRRRPVR